MGWKDYDTKTYKFQNNGMAGGHDVRDHKNRGKLREHGYIGEKVPTRLVFCPVFT